MKVRMKTVASGPNFSATEGQEFMVPGEMSAEMARDLLNGGYAEAVGAEVEAAVEPAPPEAAVKPRRGRPRKT